MALCAATDTSLSRWLVAWVGDCRVYRVSAVRGAAAQLLTQDDTYRHLSEQPPAGGSLDDPARMVGNGAVDAPNVRDVDLGRDEMLLAYAATEFTSTPGRATSHDFSAERCLWRRAAYGSSNSHGRAAATTTRRYWSRSAPSARALGLRVCVSFAALIAVVAGALSWLDSDWVTAQRLALASAPLVARMQP